MDIATLTSKHQITIPTKIRRLLNLHQGDQLAFEDFSFQFFLRPHHPALPAQLDQAGTR